MDLACWVSASTQTQRPPRGFFAGHLCWSAPKEGEHSSEHQQGRSIWRGRISIGRSWTSKKKTRCPDSNMGLSQIEGMTKDPSISCWAKGSFSPRPRLPAPMCLVLAPFGILGQNYLNTFTLLQPLYTYTYDVGICIAIYTLCATCAYFSKTAGLIHFVPVWASSKAPSAHPIGRWTSKSKSLFEVQDSQGEAHLSRQTRHAECPKSGLPK